MACPACTGVSLRAVGLAEPGTPRTLPWKLGLEEEQAWDRRGRLRDQEPREL